MLQQTAAHESQKNDPKKKFYGVMFPHLMILHIVRMKIFTRKKTWCEKMTHKALKKEDS